MCGLCQSFSDSRAPENEDGVCTSDVDAIPLERNGVDGNEDPKLPSERPFPWRGIGIAGDENWDWRAEDDEGALYVLEE